MEKQSNKQTKELVVANFKKKFHILDASGDFNEHCLVWEWVVIHKHTLYFIRLNKILKIYSPNLIYFFVVSF